MPLCMLNFCISRWKKHICPISSPLDSCSTIFLPQPNIDHSEILTCCSHACDLRSLSSAWSIQIASFQYDVVSKVTSISIKASRRFLRIQMVLCSLWSFPHQTTCYKGEKVHHTRPQDYWNVLTKPSGWEQHFSSSTLLRCSVDQGGFDKSDLWRWAPSITMGRALFSIYHDSYQMSCSQVWWPQTSIHCLIYRMDQTRICRRW